MGKASLLRKELPIVSMAVIMVYYDLLLCYCRDFSFEKINKVWRPKYL
jgi:hypothetical protein